MPIILDEAYAESDERDRAAANRDRHEEHIAYLFGAVGEEHETEHSARLVLEVLRTYGLAALTDDAVESLAALHWHENKRARTTQPDDLQLTVHELAVHSLDAFLSGPGWSTGYRLAGTQADGSLRNIAWVAYEGRNLAVVRIVTGTDCTTRASLENQRGIEDCTTVGDACVRLDALREESGFRLALH